MMVIHSKTRLTPFQREEIWSKYCERWKVRELAIKYNVSKPTIYKILKQARIKVFRTKNSTNERYRSLQYWLKRLAKIEQKIIARKNAEARRYNKKYPWEMVHMDTKGLPRLKWQMNTEYLFVMIDDYSRELYASIKRDKTQVSSTEAFMQFVDECPYKIESILTDNWTEYKWTKEHMFEQWCEQLWIKHRYTKVAHPQTNGKAERVIRTLIEMRLSKEEFISSEQRKMSLNRFINRYNTVKPHKWIWDKTPYEVIYEFYFQ